jgi:hypothetical protein
VRRRYIATAVLALAGLAGVLPAIADARQPTIVSDNPVDFTPHVLDGTVWAATVVGDTVVVGGSFNQVTDSTGKVTYPRKNIFAYGLRDGQIRPWAPAVDGPVYALAAGASNSVYLGGSFRTVGGAAQRGLARISLTNGLRFSAFRAVINWGDVRAIAAYGSRVYAGGTFTAISGVNRTALARMDANTGAVDTGFDAGLSAPGLDRTRVEHFDLSPDGRKLVAVGAILKAQGRDRVQVVVLDVAGTRAVLSDWYTDAYRPACMKGFDTYLRQVKFAPDGKYFVIVSTGRAADPAKLCDSAARFEVAGAGRHNPTWVNHTGGDSLYAVAVTGSVVYVGGHQRYLDNPYGSDAKGPGPGAKERIGIGAIHPLNGKALSWDPRRERGVGVRVFVSTPYGLIVGSDTDQLGREYHGKLGMFPL